MSISSRNPNSLYSLELEADFLSAIIRKPEALADCPFINAQDFSPTNRVIFATIKACMASEQEFNKIVLIDKLNSLSIKIQGEISPAIYVNGLELRGVSESAVEGIGKELKRWTVRRTLSEIGKKIQDIASNEETKKDGSFKRSAELVADATAEFNRQVNILGGGVDEPKDLFSDIEEYIEGLGETPGDDGPRPPFPLYYKLWGTFSPGDMSVFCARPKGAKSTFLMNLAEQCIEQDPDVLVLMLDTELETERVQRRAVASMANINEFFIRTGLWKKHPEMVDKVRASWSRIKRLMNRLSHIYVGGKDADEMLSLCRRWHHKHAYGKNKKVLICLDYIKLGSVDLENLGAIKDYQSVGRKVDKFKQLATELQCHVLTAAQTNRSNESKSVADRKSDGSSIGLSDFISQYASNIYLLEKLTLEQIAMFNSLDCTHTLSCVYARNLGPEGAAPLVRYKDERGKDRWTENFIFYRIKNFRVEELVDFRVAVEKMKTIGAQTQTDEAKGEML